ncbi:hypothetical protein LSTR_LSTR015610 [Laodelphax striatellus]|uniref:ceramide glucosyltransferase n=1 Tax=Laodelphax striatellus TaxID=195883 RepID=A0A482WTA7_LAOST|nr:hypothetical protein LSTR_LSTR015610 [Laodelphax striatellus]UVW99791.1 ceramide glucotransference 2 [Laodelphax striatellus]
MFRCFPSTCVLYGASILIIFFWCLMWMHHVITIIYAKSKLYKKLKLCPESPSYVGVSIIKPLMGFDPNLLSNLETFFTMDYDCYEILFCVAEEGDPAIKVVNSLLDKFPTVDAKLFVGNSVVGVNPKINNMQSGYSVAKHPLILISDSGIRMKPDTLKDMVEHMTDKVGLVHQLPFVCDKDDSLVSIMEQIFFGTCHARFYLLANLLNLNCVTGMSLLVRKSLLDEVGGLQSFGSYLAEDFFIGKSLRDRGWKLQVSAYPALQNATGYGMDYFRNRLKRWIKLRLKMVPFVTFLEPFTQSLLIGFLASWAGTYLFAWNPVAVFMVHIFLWFICDWTMFTIVHNGPLRISRFVFLVVWLLREVDSNFLFMSALADPSIVWRDKAFRVSWGGLTEKITEK